MKRGLKVNLTFRELTSRREVTTVTPMKRGLKAPQGPASPCSVGRVTTVTPMKRGLKATQNTSSAPFISCYNRYPDEKGTESHVPSALRMHPPSGYNRYPDEKGTESAHTSRPDDMRL